MGVHAVVVVHRSRLFQRRVSEAPVRRTEVELAPVRRREAELALVRRREAELAPVRRMPLEVAHCTFEVVACRAREAGQ